jgi:hypothetical protein
MKANTASVQALPRREGGRKCKVILSQGTWYPLWDSNWARLEKKRRTLLLYQSARSGAWSHVHPPIAEIMSEARQGNRQPQLPRIVIRLTELNTWNWMEQQLQRNSWKAKKLIFQATEQACLLTVTLPRSFLGSAVLTCFCDSFVCLDGSKVWWSC